MRLDRDLVHGNVNGQTAATEMAEILCGTFCFLLSWTRVYISKRISEAEKLQAKKIEAREGERERTRGVHSEQLRESRPLFSRGTAASQTDSKEIRRGFGACTLKARAPRRGMNAVV